MRYAILNKNTVENIIEADEVFAQKVGAETIPDDVCIGWRKNGEVFESPPPGVINWDVADIETINRVLADNGSVVRALALLVMDELNDHAAKITAILDAADTASSLATFKTSMLAIVDQPQRTRPQLVAALKARIR